MLTLIFEYLPNKKVVSEILWIEKWRKPEYISNILLPKDTFLLGRDVG
jgi:hypothetical protein